MEQTSLMDQARDALIRLQSRTNCDFERTMRNVKRGQSNVALAWDAERTSEMESKFCTWP